MNHSFVSVLLDREGGKILFFPMLHRIAQVLKLSLSSCAATQFSCTDGLCIDLLNRCATNSLLKCPQNYLPILHDASLQINMGELLVTKSSKILENNQSGKKCKLCKYSKSHRKRLFGKLLVTGESRGPPTSSHQFFRCDFKNHCPDKSDESDCEIVRRYYQKKTSKRW